MHTFEAFNAEICSVFCMKMECIYVHLVKNFCPVFDTIWNDFNLWFQLRIQDCAYSTHECILLKKTLHFLKKIIFLDNMNRK